MYDLGISCKLETEEEGKWTVKITIDFLFTQSALFLPDLELGTVSTCSKVIDCRCNYIYKIILFFHDGYSLVQLPLSH